MILADTSVWVDFFSPSPSRAGTELRRMIADAEPFALSGVIVSEILQGLRRDADQIERHLSQWDMLEPLGFSTYREAGGHFPHRSSKRILINHHRHFRRHCP